MRHFVAITGTGLTAVFLHPMRGAVTIAALVIVLLPYLVGIGMSRGLRDDADAAVLQGADLYVTGEQFGRPVPVPLSAADDLRAIPGVVSVVPRIVGRITLGKDRIRAVVVGVPLEQFPSTLECVQGRLYRGGSRNELVVGAELARLLDLNVGSFLPPFYHSRQGEHVSEVVGIFRSDVSTSQARLIVTSLETAAKIFDQPDLATELLVDCQPGLQDQARQAILNNVSFALPGGAARPHVKAREDLELLLPQDLLQREGIFTLLFVLCFVVALLVVLASAGFGLAERRREIGIFKATGWQTDELLLRSLTESFILSVIGASASILMAFVWLRAFNGYWIASIFLAGMERMPAFRVPFRLTPVPALLAFLIAFVVVMSGSFWSTWRAATAAPREAMR